MPTYLSTRAVPKTRRGIALLAFVPALVVLLVLMMAFVGVTVDASRWTERRIDLMSVRTGADTATRLAVESTWTDFEQSTGGGASDLNDVRAFLDGLGVPNQGNVAVPGDIELRNRLGLTTNIDCELELDGTVIESVRARRIDELRATRLEFSTTAVAQEGTAAFAAANTRHTVQDVFVIEAPPFEGLDFVLLANNINCIMCHTTIDNVERVYNQDASRRGTFPRVKTASIEAFHFRSNPESTIAGTLYLGGAALDDHGAPITDWSSLSLDGFSFDVNGRLNENGAGALTQINLSAGDPLNPQPLQSLYLDYFAHESDTARYQVDGPMPDSFPLPFPDDGGYDPVSFAPTPGGAQNRVVDDNEFLSSIHDATGRVSGGNIAVIPLGTQIDTTAELTALRTGTDSVDRVAAGNVYMHGTFDNPIRLDGTSVISGDLVLSGYVVGTGSLRVRGNIYVAGDLQYRDATGPGGRFYGRSESGESNLLTLTAGQNIVIGDMYHARWGSGSPANGLESGSWNFTMDEIAIFNRMEWMKTQPTLPGQGFQQQTGVQTVQNELFETVQVQVDQPVYGWVGTGTYTTEPTYAWQGTGVFQTVPIYETQQTGTQQVPIYQTVHHPADPPEPYGSPWTEQVVVGYTTEPVFTQVQIGTQSIEIFDWVQTGTHSVEVMNWVQTGTQSVTQSVTQPFSPPQYETVQTPIYEWVTPQYPNPHYQGPTYIPRYYSFREGAPVPIFNKGGYFDPDSEIWHAPEHPGSWDPSLLTFADPNDSSDPLLFNGSGQPKAVVSALAPSAGWLSDELLQTIVNDNFAGRDPAEPVAVDAWLYSSNSVFGVIPPRNSPGVSGRMRVNGAVIAADIGLLAPNGLELNFDRRGRSEIDVRSSQRLAIRRRLWAPGNNQRHGAVSATLVK